MITESNTGTEFATHLAALISVRLETPDFIRPLFGHLTNGGKDQFITWPIRGLMKSGVSRRNVAKWVANLVPVFDSITILYYISTGWIIYINKSSKYLVKIERDDFIFIAFCK